MKTNLISKISLFALLITLSAPAQNDYKFEVYDIQMSVEMITPNEILLASTRTNKTFFVLKDNAYNYELIEGKIYNFLLFVDKEQTTARTYAIIKYCVFSLQQITLDKRAIKKNLNLTIKSNY